MGGRGGGDSHVDMIGMLVKILKNNPKIWVWHRHTLTPKSYQLKGMHGKQHIIGRDVQCVL